MSLPGSISLVVIPLALFSALISYEDFRKGVIRNRYIAALLLGGLIFQYLNGFPAVLTALQYFVYGLAISFLLWFVGLWPAGDAKLFSAYILYFPPSMFGSSLVMNYSINVFVPIFLLFSAYVLFKSKGSAIKEALEYTFEPYRVFVLVVILLGLVGFMMDLLKSAGVQGDFFVTILLLFIVFEIFYGLLSAKTELVFTLIAALRIIVKFETVTSLKYLYDFTGIVVSFLVLRFFLLHLTYYFFSREVDIEELEEGMSPSEGIVDYGDKYGKLSFLNASLINYMMQKKENFIHDLVYLSEEDVEKIKELHGEGELGFDTLRVDQKQQFAAMIFTGFLLTLLVGGDLFQLIKTVIY